MADLMDDAIAAFKADLDISDLTDFQLNAGQQTALMEAMELQTRILPMIRSMRMERSTEHIDSINFHGRVTVAGSESTGAIRVLDDDDKVKPTGEQNILTAKELCAVTAIRDRMLRRIIGQGQTGPQIVNMLGNAAGRDFEEFAFFANSSIAYADDDVLHQTDGFAVEAGKQLFGGSDTNYDRDDEMYPFTLFDAMIDELDEQYKDDLTNYQFQVGWEDFNKALDLYGARNTPLGDQVLQSGILPPYKGIKIVYVPLFSRAKYDGTSLGKNHVGRIAMLNNVLNMNWGIFHEMTLEPKRVPEGRASEWYLSYEGDVAYQEKNAAVCAFHDLTSAP